MTEDDEDRVGQSPAWIITFADLMALLLTCFIMLLSMSTLDSQQTSEFQATAESMRQVFGHERSTVGMLGNWWHRGQATLADLSIAGRERTVPSNLPADVVAPRGLGQPESRPTPPGRRTSMGTTIQFPLASDRLTAAAQQHLKQEAATWRGKPQKIEIRGHVARLQAEALSQEVDPWQLAFQRARSTLEFLSRQGIEPSRLRMAVAGVHEPANLEADLQASQQNARVEIFVLDEIATNLEQQTRLKETRVERSPIANATVTFQP